MGESENQRPIVSQKIEGDGNQVAGEKIININEGDSFTPDPNNPNLVSCKQCDWPGLSRTADECPKCGHNYLRDRLIAHEKAKQEKERSLAIITTLVFVVFIGTTQISSRTRLDFLDSLVIMIGLLVALWLGWIWLSVQYEIWRSKRQQR